MEPTFEEIQALINKVRGKHGSYARLTWYTNEEHPWELYIDNEDWIFGRAHTYHLTLSQVEDRLLKVFNIDDLSLVSREGIQIKIKEKMSELEDLQEDIDALQNKLKEFEND